MLALHPGTTCIELKPQTAELWCVFTMLTQFQILKDAAALTEKLSAYWNEGYAAELLWFSCI